MILRQYFKVTGVNNTIAYDDGLRSTEVEKKRLLSVNVIVNQIIDNQVQGYHERAKVFDIPDRLIDSETDLFTTAYPKPGARINEIEVGLEIPVGEAFKVAMKSGATATNLFGCYNYELM